MNRCPKCQVFVEDNLRVCPDCHFDFSPPSSHMRPAAPSFVGHPSFAKKERFILVGIYRRASAVDVALCLIVVALCVGYFVLNYQGFNFVPAENSPNKQIAAVAHTIAGPLPRTPAAEPAGPAMVMSGEPVERSAPAAEPVAKPSQARPRAPGFRNWTFEGHVVDLMTLEPIKAADLVFDDVVRGKHFETSSLPDGFFTLVLPAAPQGYFVKVSHPKYVGHPMVEKGAEPKQNALSESERMRLAIQLAQTLVRSDAIVARGGRQNLTIFLSPKDIIRP